MKTAHTWSLLLLPLVFMAEALIAQSPPAIPIQSVVKDNNGNPAKNRKVFARIAIRQQQISGSIIWEEDFETTTNEDGIYTIIIGKGNKLNSVPATMNNISEIDWGKGPYFINHKLAVAPSIPSTWWTPASNYVDLGTIQMLSVPYALYAANASVTNVATSLPRGPANTFLLTDSLGNVKWAPPQAANITVAKVANINLAPTLQSGRKISIQPNTTSVVEVQVAGAMPGDPVLVAPKGDYQNWSVYSAWVGTPGIVKIRFANYTNTQVDIEGGQYKIVVIK